MSESAYLVVASRQRLESMEGQLRGLLGLDYSEALVPVSARRAILPATLADELARRNWGTPVARLLKRMRAERIEPISDQRVAQLLADREPSELFRSPSRGERLLTEAYDWHLTMTGLVDAWELVGQPGAIDWGDVKVAQVDTGYTENPTLGWGDGQSPFVLLDRDRNFCPADFEGQVLSPNKEIIGRVDDARDPLRGAAWGHGTRTSSVLAGLDLSDEARRAPASGGAAGQAGGYFGAAPGIPFVPIRLSDSVGITHLVGGALPEALNYVADDLDVQVTTISLGAALPTRLYDRDRQALARLYEKGVIVCCAAGNAVRSVVEPARSPWTIAVAGCMYDKRPWKGGCRGPSVDIAAPAAAIWRATTSRSGKFGFGAGEGTSYAAPQVAGTAALWLRHRGEEITMRYREGWQRVEAFRRLLHVTAQPGVDWDGRYGKGILNAKAVLEAPLPNPEDLTRAA